MSNETTTKTVVKDEVGSAFKWFHATSVNGGAMLMAAVIASWFSVYMTDTLKIPAAAASAVMFIATLWDAINDPMMGVIADRTKTRWGRYRPYFLFAPILLTFFATMIWVDWGFQSTGVKVAYVLIMYIGYGMTVTMYTMPQMAILPAAVRDNQQRNMIISMGAGVCAAAFTIGSTFTSTIPGFFNRIGIKNGKEKYLVESENEHPFKEITRVLKYKEVWPNLIAWIMASVGYGLMFSSSVYYMMYYLARPDLITIYMGVVSVGALVSMVVLMPIFLKLFKTGQRTILVSQTITVVLYIILFFFGKTNFVLLCVITFIATCTGSMENALVNVLVNDTIDFIMLKEAKSANGVISAIKGFSQKCGNTISNSGILAALSISGYVAGAVGQQPESTLFALNFLRFGAPALAGIILILCVVKNPMNKYVDQIAAMKEKMGHNE